MGLLDRFKTKKSYASKIKEPVYVSKLGSKRQPQNKNGAVQKKGVRKSFIQRYINIVRSDLNVLRSIWKPRVVYVTTGVSDDSETIRL